MLGFVVLSHKAPNQLLRLCRTLNKLYDNPPIACHHDFSQAELHKNLFPTNVHFVEEWMVTGWGKWSLVAATLSALRLLYTIADPDYFFTISGADYPTARPESVRRDLLQSGADAFINAISLKEALSGNVKAGDAHLAHHRLPHNIALERDHYLRAQLKIPILRIRPPKHSTTVEPYPRLGAMTVALPFDTPFSPFDENFQCYVGSQWFTGNRKVAAKLLNPAGKDLHLQKYYQKRVIPDESYFQTIICNDPDIVYEDRTFRYASWHGAHPVDLKLKDLHDIMDSRAHFSRKFGPDTAIRDAIDRDLCVAVNTK